MNKPAVKLEEQIISLFSNLETELYQGWVLKQTSCKMIIYPLYGGSLTRQDISDRIKECEAVSRQKSLPCEFRIVDHTNYYLASILEDNGYKRHGYSIAERYINNHAAAPHHNTNLIIHDPKIHDSKIHDPKIHDPKIILTKTTEKNRTEKIIADDGSIVGIRRQDLLYLPDGNLSCKLKINDIFQFAAENQISRILVNIPEDETLSAHYQKSGFRKLYLYHRYQKEE